MFWKWKGNPEVGWVTLFRGCIVEVASLKVNGNNPNYNFVACLVHKRLFPEVNYPGRVLEIGETAHIYQFELAKAALEFRPDLIAEESFPELSEAVLVGTRTTLC